MIISQEIPREAPWEGVTQGVFVEPGNRVASSVKGFLVFSLKNRGVRIEI